MPQFLARARPVAPLALFLVAIAGCSGSGRDSAARGVTERSAPLETTLGGVGRDLYGHALNGQSLNGEILDGQVVSWVSLDGVWTSAAQPGSVALVGTAFRRLGDGLGGAAGADGNANGSVGVGPPRPGDPAEDDGSRSVGAVFTGTLISGGVMPLRVDGVVAGDTDRTRGLRRYAVSYQTAAGWQPLCGTTSSGGPGLAIPLQDRWDYRQGAPGGGAKISDPRAFTFACEGYVLAKCAEELGYRPWEFSNRCHGAGCKGTSLAPLHQACTRALRADYCGDGTPHTVDHTPVDIYDGIGLNTSSPGWPFEAEWTEAGGSCIARERIPSMPAPDCWSRLQSGDCGDRAHFSAGTLLMSQVSR